MDSTEEMDSSTIEEENNDRILTLFEANKCFYLIDFDKLISRLTQRSSLEMLLLLHYSLTSMSVECQCHVGDLFNPLNTNILKKCFTSMKNIIEFLSTKVSESLVKDFNSEWKSDYQLHLLYLLKIAFIEVYQEIEVRRHLLDKIDPTMMENLLDTVIEITYDIAILVSRHGRHYRKEMQRCSTTSRARPHVQLPIRHQFFKYYEKFAGIGRFPHIFWQETPLSEKISSYDSLKALFSNGNEGKCCICMTDEEEFMNNFAIFLECRHLVCASCTERLLVDMSRTR